MGESDRYLEYKNSPKKKRFTLGQENNALVALFALNIIFFLILLTLQVGYFFYDKTPELFHRDVIDWFALPAGLIKLSERPWTVIVFMFSDTGGNIMRILSNMIWLWSFGYILQQLAGNDKIIPVFIYGGLMGGLFYITTYHLIPSLNTATDSASLLGSNASVMAVATATTTLSPDYRIFRHIRNGFPLWVLLIIYLFIDFAGVASMNAAVSLSHLGGALAGFLFIVLLRKGYDGSNWMNSCYHWAVNLFTPSKPVSGKSIKEKIFYNNGDRAPFTKKSTVTQSRIDELLDKINAKGYHFLTEEEKEFLKKASEENQED